MLTDPATWGALLSLAAMEIVLGIDNIIFVAILVARVSDEQREKIRKLGIGLALIFRLGLLLTIKWMMGLTSTLMTIPIWQNEISGRDLILIGGGLFLIGKSSHEIYQKLEGQPADGPAAPPKASSAASVLLQIIGIDIVFSLDSVITAVGMANELWIMIVAMIAAVGVMLAFARAVGDFVERHPSVKLLALAFLLLIGFVLLGEGFGQHISKGFIYFAMAFALGVELLNMRFRNKQAAAASAVRLHSKYEDNP
ncbi:TerC family protein [Pendulispora albinea]|uniref:TerC family protein n=1 Tax=Pendulispora albinea TaxID=2741071 RepID=A0ABZ2LSZ7_9BACT